MLVFINIRINTMPISGLGWWRLVGDEKMEAGAIFVNALSDSRVPVVY